MKRRVFFDSHPNYNCLRVETPSTDNAFPALPPTATAVRIVDESEIPTDRTFRNAWVIQAGKIGHDLTKCKAIAHDKRRVARAKEFAPLDIEATIPAKAVQAEAARQVIRDRYATIQTQIDSATDVLTLKTIVTSL